MSEIADEPRLLIRHHPITGARLTPQDTVLGDAHGRVVMAIQDRTGAVVLKFTDGHLFVIQMEGRDLVTKAYYPHVPVTNE